MDSIEFAGMAEHTQLACCVYPFSCRIYNVDTRCVSDTSNVDTSNVDTSNVVCNPFI